MTSHVTFVYLTCAVCVCRTRTCCATLRPRYNTCPSAPRSTSWCEMVMTTLTWLVRTSSVVAQGVTSSLSPVKCSLLPSSHTGGVIVLPYLHLVTLGWSCHWPGLFLSKDYITVTQSSCTVVGCFSLFSLININFIFYFSLGAGLI